MARKPDFSKWSPARHYAGVVLTPDGDTSRYARRFAFQYSAAPADRKAPFTLLQVRPNAARYLDTKYRWVSCFDSWQHADWSPAFNDQQVLEFIAQYKLRPEPIRNGHPEVYAAMVAESERVGWPTSYRDDLLVHDRLHICSPWAPDSFIWCLREMGTWVVATSPEHVNLEGTNSPHSFIKAVNRDNPDTKYYMWAGRGFPLTAVSYQRAYEWAYECAERARRYRRENGWPNAA